MRVVDRTRVVRVLVAAAFIAVAFMPVFASPARACSCATPTDIEEWVDGSEAVFVGSLIEKQGGRFAEEATYVFKVEEWIKGDLGDVIEVQSASNGAACGFEFWSSDQRIGAAIYEDNGELHGGLCSQIDADVLLAAMEGLTQSATGIGHLIAGHGWGSTELTVLDEMGGQVAELSIPGEPSDFDGTQGLEACPGGEVMIQWTQTRVIVRDLATLDPVATHQVAEADGYPVIRDASCRTDDASSILVAAAYEFGAKLLEVGDGVEPLRDTDGDHFNIGTDFVIAQSDHEDDAIWIDVESGEVTPLTTTPPGQLRSVSVAPHPTDRRVAVVETDFNEGGPVEATLSIMDDTGTALEQFHIPWETYSPIWLDAHRVLVTAYNYDDWEQSFSFVFDLNTGERIEVEGWDAASTIADGDVLYGVDGGTILTAHLSSGEIGQVVTLPTQQAGPLLVLAGGPEFAATTTTTAPAPTESSTPPLVAPESVTETPDQRPGYQWIGGGAIAVFVGLLVWLAARSRREEA